MKAALGKLCTEMTQACLQRMYLYMFELLLSQLKIKWITKKEMPTDAL